MIMSDPPLGSSPRLHSCLQSWLATTARLATRITALVLLSTPAFYGYSVLTHEAIVDSLWEASIQRCSQSDFRRRLPRNWLRLTATFMAAALSRTWDITLSAASYSAIYALRSQRRLHRGADPRIAEFERVRLALGALAHYAADNNGHRLGTNVAVPVFIQNSRANSGGA